MPFIKPQIHSSFNAPVSNSPTLQLSNSYHLPKSPGVYLMRDLADKILYVGKARNLKKRVSSYFQKRDVGPKIEALLSSVRRIDYVTCASEREALLLEAAWIKKHRPVFNAMWKDDKSYPYAVLTVQEDFPRLYLARRKHIPQGALYFGPYPSAGKIRGLIRGLLRSGQVPLRPCRWDFSFKKPLSPQIIHSCLYFHTKQCPAPCAGRITKEAYRKIARKAAQLFSGNRTRLAMSLRREMAGAAGRLDFEAAQKIKEGIEALEHIRQKVAVTEINGGELGPCYEPNAAIKKLREVFGLAVLPRHIEGFDISNLYGSDCVGSMVCFINGRPNKNHYRRFRIKTVSGIDDFAMINEIVGRRLKRLIDESEPLPDVILIDGGPGQLASARRAVKEEMDKARQGWMTGSPLRHRPVLAALAKSEEILYLDRSPRPAQAIRLPASNEALRLCMGIRDEAHRFALAYHKKLRGSRFAIT